MCICRVRLRRDVRLPAGRSSEATALHIVDKRRPLVGVKHEGAQIRRLAVASSYATLFCRLHLQAISLLRPAVGRLFPLVFRQVVPHVFTFFDGHNSRQISEIRSFDSDVDSIDDRSRSSEPLYFRIVFSSSR